MSSIRIPNGIMTYSKGFKAGDLPPEGYLEWHEWAEVQFAAGIRQSSCDKCDKWHTPQELPCEAQAAEPRESD